MPVQTEVDITIDSNDSPNWGIEASVDNFDSNLPQSGKRLGFLYMTAAFCGLRVNPERAVGIRVASEQEIQYKERPERSL